MPEPDAVEKFDMVIIGAGFHGLSLARTHLTLNPSTTLLILDAQPTIGGVWATSRLYPSLKTNSQAGHFEFSDFPMCGNPRYPEVKPGEHIPGDAVRRYLEDYAAAFDLTRRVRCGRKVVEAEDLGAEGWMLQVETAATTASPPAAQPSAPAHPSAPHHRIHASRLVLATGLTSTPKLPRLPGQSAFTSPILHVRDFGAHCLRPAAPKTVLILSANKSAADAAHHHALAGARVVWLISPRGHGPCWLAPPRITPLRILAESLITTRAVTLLHPCAWGAADGLGGARRALHGTGVGRAAVEVFQKKIVQAGVEKAVGFAACEGTERLRPWCDVFWVGTGRGLLNYGETDVFGLVREGRIEVRVAEVVGMEGEEVRLGDGTSVGGVDAVVCSTGWEHRPSVRFVRGGVDIAGELGLPCVGGERVGVDEAMVKRADEQILREIPRLRDQPPPARPPHLRGEKCEAVDPASRTMDDAYALYRFMVPPERIHTRTLAFAGMLRTASTSMVAEMQALWLSAFFSHRLPHLEPGLSLSPPSVPPTMNGSTPAIEKGQLESELHTTKENQAREEISARVKYEAILHARYGLWRYPHGFGAVMPDFFFDSLPMFDLMLSELGLRRWRKSNFFMELFSSYGPHDYVGLVDEWSEKWKKGHVLNEDEVLERKRALVMVGITLLLWVTVMLCTMAWVWSKW
ncbi:hypothetical protein GTA08_BOTSDO08137 [Neofusicoccum parvum]|nr:hypothetical protein GTA08_BOTSDO08137 [Neofusicoccum parvum]